MTGLPHRVYMSFWYPEEIGDTDMLLEQILNAAGNLKTSNQSTNNE